MACNCQERKKSFAYIEMLAIKFSMAEQKDIQIYSRLNYENKFIYDFEPIDDSRENIIKIIIYSDIMFEERNTVNVEYYNNQGMIFEPGRAIIIKESSSAENGLYEWEYVTDE
jgi:hypothetical protein